MRSVAIVSLAAVGVGVPRVPRTRSKGGGVGVTPLDSSVVDAARPKPLQSVNALGLDAPLPSVEWLRTLQLGLWSGAPPPRKPAPPRLSAKAWQLSLPQMPTKVWQPGLQRRGHECVPDHQWVRVAASLLGVYSILAVEDYLTGSDTSTVSWESEELNLVLLPSSDPVS